MAMRRDSVSALLRFEVSMQAQPNKFICRTLDVLLLQVLTGKLRYLHRECRESGRGLKHSSIRTVTRSPVIGEAEAGISIRVVVVPANGTSDQIPVKYEDYKEPYPTIRSLATILCDVIAEQTDMRRSNPTFAPGCIGLGRRSRTTIFATHHAKERPKGIKLNGSSGPCFPGTAASRTMAKKSKTKMAIRKMNFAFQRGSAAMTSERPAGFAIMNGFITTQARRGKINEVGESA